ncbi:hypothetical protein O3P69_000714 [Scylla paramamosain]|uniref:Chitin-binding type-2 domain-containing protein n=1 Tax=Scylla paramamosain TaxID=85552 RepID=A0AAW0UTD6_SCYPA
MKWSIVLVAVSLAVASGQTGKQCAADISAKCPPPGIGTEPVFFEVPEHCSQYCECSNGIAWLFVCARGTLWDTWIEECIADYLVDCGSRPNP